MRATQIMGVGAGVMCVFAYVYVCVYVDRLGLVILLIPSYLCCVDVAGVFSFSKTITHSLIIGRLLITGGNRYGIDERADSKTRISSATSLVDSILLIVALCFHSVFEGIAIGIADSKADAWKALWSISLHKIFAAVAMVIALLRMIPDRAFISCASYVFAFGISSPIGVGIGIIIDDTTEGCVADWIFAVSMGIACGVFVYVSMTCYEVMRLENRRL